MTSHRDLYRDEEDDLFRIGHGIGPVGRWIRLLLGIQFVTFLGLNAFYLNPVPQDEIAFFALKVGGYTLLIAVTYLVVFYAIGELVLSKMNPWTGTVIFLGIPTVLGLLGYLTPALQMAFGLYVGGSLILIFFMRYGGCEVVALPSLLFGRRFTMYCPFNAVDAVERAVTPDESAARNRLLSRISVAITFVVGGYFFLAEQHILRNSGISIEIDRRWSLLLLIPLLHLTALTARHYRSDKSITAPKVRKAGLGVIILALAMIAFISDAVSGSHLWRAAMALGGILVLLQIGAIVTRRLKQTRVRLDLPTGQT